MDIKHFNALFWLLALSIMFFYNGVFPFVADARFLCFCCFPVLCSFRFLPQK